MSGLSGVSGRRGGPAGKVGPAGRARKRFNRHVYRAGMVGGPLEGHRGGPTLIRWTRDPTKKAA